MKTSPPTSAPRRLGTAFRDAARGLRGWVATESHARLYAGIAAATAAVGWWLNLAPQEWALVLTAMALVGMAEAINTALEKLADTVHPARHPDIGQAKDIAAGAVLLAILFALGIGLTVLGPRLLAKL